MIFLAGHSLANWLSRHALPCIYKKYFGIPCPGCGMQRAMIALLQGNFRESLEAYPALLPIFFLAGFLLLHLVFRFRHGAAILKYSFMVTVAIIVFHYIYILAITYF